MSVELVVNILKGVAFFGVAFLTFMAGFFKAKNDELNKNIKSNEEVQQKKNAWNNTSLSDKFKWMQNRFNK